MNSLSPAPAAQIGAGIDGKSSTRLIVASLALLAAVQAALVFTKSMNWDEFLHYSQVYDLPRGRLIWYYQTLHTRLFFWVPAVSQDVIAQLEVARLIMLGCEVIAASMIVLLARMFVDRGSALIAGLFYLGSPYVLLHGFSFRPDPMATASLMTALYVVARCRLSVGNLLLAGALIGLAGAMTIKSIFYLPCFAGVAWFRFAEDKATPGVAWRMAAVAPFAGVVFAIVLYFHKQGIVVQPDGPNSVIGNVNSYLTGGLFRNGQFISGQALGAPLIPLSILLLPVVWKEGGGSRKIVLAGLLAPLLTLVFYRNIYPYFFVLLLPPVCVAISPSIAWLSRRSGVPLLVAIALLAPLAAVLTQPHRTLVNQRALIGEVHRLFQEPTGYLAFTGFVPDYPRIVPFLVAGVGLERYNAAGIPAIAHEIERGDVGFVLADSAPVIAGLSGHELPGTLQPRDVAALHGNFIPYVSDLWIAGKMLCPTAGLQTLTIYRPGPYSLDGGAVSIDKRPVGDGATIVLQAGRHNLVYGKGACLRLWALPKVPRPPASFPDGPLMDSF